MEDTRMICSLCAGAHAPVDCLLGATIIESARWKPVYVAIRVLPPLVDELAVRRAQKPVQPVVASGRRAVPRRQSWSVFG